MGGFVGFNNDAGTIEDASATGSVTAENQVGGFAGENEGVIRRSSATGAVIGTDFEVGGFVGLNSNGATIEDSSATGAVTGSKPQVGGFVGENDGTIRGSSADGSATGTLAQVGGFVGYNDNGTIEDSSATGMRALAPRRLGVLGVKMMAPSPHPPLQATQKLRVMPGVLWEKTMGQSKTLPRQEMRALMIKTLVVSSGETTTGLFDVPVRLDPPLRAIFTQEALPARTFQQFRILLHRETP